jgi:FtsH-binding integral membrane protein
MKGLFNTLKPVWNVPLVQLTPIQSSYMKRMCFLLFIQLLLLLATVFTVHKTMPDRECLFFSCNLTTDIISIIVIELLFIGMIFYFNDIQSTRHYVLRCIGFFGMGLVLSYVLGITYNIKKKEAKDPEEVTRNFYIALGVTVVIFIAVFVLLPFLLPYTKTFARLTVYLFVGLILLIFASLIFARSYTFIVLGLFLFLVYLVVDMALLTYRCQEPNTIGCDAPTGATTLYLDLVNIFIRLLELLDWENRK